MLIYLGIVFFIILILFRIPVALAMAITGMLGYSMLSGGEQLLSYLKTFVFWKLASYELWSIPLFLLMGNCLARCGLGEILFTLFGKVSGSWRGGLCLSTILGSAGIGALSGSSIATVSTMGAIAGPKMMKKKYPTSLATSVIAMGGNLGMIIPPSVLLIIYATLVEGNIVKLFQAAIIPAVLCVVFYIVVLIMHPQIKKLPKEERVTRKVSFFELIPLIICFGCIFAMYFGIVTIIEAAALGAVTSVVLLQIDSNKSSQTIKGNKKLINAFLDTARATSMIFMILLGADIFRTFLSAGGLPYVILEYLSELDPWIIFVVYILGLIILGCFMETFSVLLLTFPILWPVLVKLNFYDMDPESFKLWFGIVILITVELGMVTPPIGINLLTLQNYLPKVKESNLIKSISPFIGSEIFRLALLILFPPLTLWLPSILS